MRRFLISVFAIITLGLHAPATAQTSPAETRDLLEYAARFEPVSQAALAILDTSLEAADIFDQHLSGAISIEEARAALKAMRASVGERAEAVRSMVAALPDPPEGTSAFHERMKAYRSEMRLLIADIEQVALSTIDALTTGLDSDVDAIRVVEAASLRRLRVMIDTGNASIERDLQTISLSNHPQNSVLRCAIATSEATYFLASARFSYNFVDEASGDAEIDKALQQADDCERHIEEGKANQASLTTSMRAEASRAPERERAFAYKVVAMMDDYDRAWVVETNLVGTIRALASAIAARPDDFDGHDRLWDQFILHEEERSALLFERMRALQ